MGTNVSINPDLDFGDMIVENMKQSIGDIIGNEPRREKIVLRGPGTT